MSLFLILIGAILRWAITAHALGASVNLHTVGVIFIVVGVIGLVLELFFFHTFTSFFRRV